LKNPDEFLAFRKKAQEMQKKTGKPILHCYEKLARQRGFSNYVDFVSQFPDTVFNNDETFNQQMDYKTIAYDTPAPRKRY